MYVRCVSFAQSDLVGKRLHRAPLPFRREGLRAKGMEVVRDVLAHVFREYIYHVSTYSTKNNGSLTKTRT